MLRCLYPLLFVLAFAAPLFAQNIPKGADRIVLTTALPDSVLLSKLEDFLNDEGYIVDKIDKSKGSIITQYRSVGGFLQVRILANIKSSIATFKGQGSAEAGGFKSTNEPLLYKGLASGISKGGFISLNEAVRKFSKQVEDSQISYQLPQ